MNTADRITYRTGQAPSPGNPRPPGRVLVGDTGTAREGVRMKHDPDTCLLVPSDLDRDVDPVQPMASMLFTSADSTEPFAKAARWLAGYDSVEITVIDTSWTVFQGEEEPYGLRVDFSCGNGEKD